MAGTGIATFSDRLRDAVRGGGPFDDDPRVQGFASGLFTDPNDVAGERDARGAARAAAALPRPDQGRAGGQPARLPLRRRRGRRRSRAPRSTTTASPPATRPSPARRSPTSTRTTTRRCSTRSQLKLPPGTAMADRVRMNTLALATTALAQSPSFWHAGNDLLRSKSLDRNSYDSGDWFNRIDWSGAGVDLRLRAAAGARQRGEVAVHAAAAGRPGARARAGGARRGERAGARAAADPLLVAALPAGQRAADRGARHVPRRRAGADARRDRDGDRRARRGRRGGLQRDAGGRRPRPCRDSAAAAMRCTRCRRTAATRSCAARRRGAGRSRCRAARSRCSSRAAEPRVDPSRGRLRMAP